ncbi:hypothetical protein SAMD00023353_9600120 [Rosellinia necatrix]|uniref:Uncharacterized protein n=1 Tax=Rosellinia necatrix TaxID=77044 RepID=A0A1S8AAX9_ROSNE|nr:hypothetical protein SAMD00023353_9600120 [Rosellinia necatrix]
MIQIFGSRCSVDVSLANYHTKTRITRLRSVAGTAFARHVNGSPLLSGLEKESRLARLVRARPSGTGLPSGIATEESK